MAKVNIDNADEIEEFDIPVVDKVSNKKYVESKSTKKPLEVSDDEESDDEESGFIEFDGDDGESCTLDDSFADAITEVVETKEKKQTARKKELTKQSTKDRNARNQTKRRLGVRLGKQSKYGNARTKKALMAPDVDRALHLVMNTSRSEIYKDGADVSSRMMLGIPAYGNQCNRNAYEHFIALQNRIKDDRLANGKKAPNWIIISVDTSAVLDRNLITRLEQLKDHTVVAGPSGFMRIPTTGKWFDVYATDTSVLRGCYVQSSMENADWSFVIDPNFRKNPRSRVLIVHGPFIAVRGDFFMGIDFTDMAEKSKGGYHHYSAYLSMEAYTKGKIAASINSLAVQHDRITPHINEPEFLHDQALFTAKWIKHLPASV